jgi:hypothetical protein
MNRSTNLSRCCQHIQAAFNNSPSLVCIVHPSIICRAAGQPACLPTHLGGIRRAVHQLPQGPVPVLLLDAAQGVIEGLRTQHCLKYCRPSFYQSTQFNWVRTWHHMYAAPDDHNTTGCADDRTCVTRFSAPASLLVNSPCSSSIYKSVRSYHVMLNSEAM